MFKGVMKEASAAGSLIAGYVVRVLMAVPFIVALGFATAAFTLMLIDRFGRGNAYFMVAGGFAVVGVLATLVVAGMEAPRPPANTPGIQAAADHRRQRSMAFGTSIIAAMILAAAVFSLSKPVKPPFQAPHVISGMEVLRVLA